jgi:16S rRNA (cytosine1402-N4)-methyltransferase
MGRRRERPQVSREFEHQPVLEQEVLDLLSPAPGSTVVDGTVGGGGHAQAILERNGPDGRLIGLDVDAEALAAAKDRLGRYGDRVRLVRSSFRHIQAVLGELGIERVDGVLLDLGVSSHQLDSPERGFRFGEETADVTPLDMRMDARLPHSAADLLAHASAPEMERWFREYSDLPGARRLARDLVQARSRAPLRTAADLLEVVRQAGIGRGRRHHPGTLVFQALRIAVNDELAALVEGLEGSIAALRPGGRLVVIAYHSAEDRIVKNVLRDAARGRTGPRGLPEAISGRDPQLRVLTRKPVGPTPEEEAANPRARSARLRAAERLEEAA